VNPIYLDCNATSPIEPEVADLMRHYVTHEFGNAGSRTHEMGRQAAKAVNEARQQIANLVEAEISDVVFTSGATESSNLAILGLASFAKGEGKTHIISTSTEHKATLEPLERLASQGFDVELLPVDQKGRVTTDQVEKAIRPETFLITVIHGNNETGVLNPVAEIADLLESKEEGIFFHVDAAQTFGKVITPLSHQRIDMMSISSHKIYGPKGIGALLIRTRDFHRPPLEPLMLGGGQERGLRPGTLPVHLIAGLGKAADLALKHKDKRESQCKEVREAAIKIFNELGAQINGDNENTLTHTLNVSIPGINSEAAIITLKEVAYISNGSACTSENYTLSHVLLAMDLPEERVEGAIRLSWSHLTPNFAWEPIKLCLETLLKND